MKSRSVIIVGNPGERSWMIKWKDEKSWRAQLSVYLSIST